MKVNLDGIVPDPTITQQGNRPSVSSSGVEQAEQDDSATLHLDSDGVGTLAAQAMSTSETRSERIEALRQAVANGQYKVDPQSVADAVLNSAQRTPS
jgi:flagellar biosynthesis anti-sigma factor FlgM